jgi:hypothetical protein
MLAAINQDMPPADTKSTRPRIPPRHRGRLRKTRRALGIIISVAATAITLLGIYIFKPSIAIEPYASTDRPFNQQFSVQNGNSIYSIKNVTPICGFPVDSDFGFQNVGLAVPGERVDALEPGAKTTLTCPVMTPPVQRELKLMPWVTYTLPLGIQRCYRAFFVGKPRPNGGAFVWTYHGSNSSCKYPN